MFSTLPPEANRQAQQLYRKLLWSYIGITSAVLGLSAVVLYSFIADSMQRQHEEELQVLAEAAAPSLEVAKTQSEFFNADTAQMHWHALEQHSQSLEWYDADGTLIIREGKVFSELALPEATTLSEVGILERDLQQDLYVVTLPVIQSGNIIGFVRASESLRILRIPLQKLRWGMVFGGAIGMGTIVLSGFWLARQALQPFVQSYQRLREFTADASHELRAPLATVQAGLDTLQATSEHWPETDLATLNSMDSATHQLRQLTDALLALARMDRPTALQEQDIPLQELLEDLVDIYEAMAEEQGVQLIYQSDKPATVHGNNGLLVQLFTNLIQNGIQYTPKGGTVTITLTQAGKHALVLVQDNGIGIATDDIPKVFERFWRADKARSRRKGGLGLGLAIANDIVKNSHGSIRLDSTLEKGTTLEVRLPAVKTISKERILFN
ncbi:MAG: sensor histidine kinase [Synechococcus sp.]